MKKSLIALAVSSAVVAPASVQAAEVYGSINTTFESSSTDNGGNFAIFSTSGDDSGGGLSDTWGSRFGVTGSEDLGNGLTAGYTFEFDIGTSSGGTGGSNNEDATVSTRLANISLGGDFGSVTMGTQWGVIYSYAGWNHYRTDGHGGATHYYMTSDFVGPMATGDNRFGTGLGVTGDPSGLRVENALTYTYGGGGYSSDPFTFSVQLEMDSQGEARNQINRTTGATLIDDEETVDSITVGAQSTLPMGVTINGTFYQESNTQGNNTDVPEPSLLTLGGRWSSGPFYVGGTFFSADTDIDTSGLSQAAAAATPDSPSAINVLAGMDFGSGYSGYVGVGTGDADRDDNNGDLTTYFLQAEKAFSSRTKIYGEFENAEIEGLGAGGTDTEQQVLAIGLKHSF